MSEHEDKKWLNEFFEKKIDKDGFEVELDEKEIAINTMKELGNKMMQHERSNQVTLHISKEVAEKMMDEFGNGRFTLEEQLELDGPGLVMDNPPPFGYRRIFNHLYEQFKWDPEKYAVLSLDEEAGTLTLKRKGNSDEDN